MKILKLEISDRLILGCLIFCFGAMVAYSGAHTVDYGPDDVRLRAYVTPGPLHPFWLPTSYDVISVPDYSFEILTIGVIIATTGFWIVIYDIHQRTPQVPG